MNAFEPSSARGPTRRSFLKTGALALAAAPLTTCGGESRTLDTTSGSRLARPDGVDDRAWARVRSGFALRPGIAYMNNASLGMPPSVVAESVAEGYRAISEEPLHGKNALQAAIADRVVPGLARFFGAEPGEISLTRNATEALHLQSIGLALGPGDEVLITTQEHPAGRRPWMLRAAREGVRVRELFVPSPFESGERVVDVFARAITDRTRAIAFCHVTRGGHLYPVAELCALARSRGIASLVDGAQAVGQLPVDLDALGCDAYSASLHKWMLGPAGTGFLYVRSDSRPLVRTAFEPEATVEQPAHAPPGTADFPVRAALAAALDFVETIGIEAVEARCRHLSDHLKRRLAELPAATMLSGPTPETSCPGSTIFEIAGVDAVAAVGRIERSAAAHIDEHRRDGHEAIRISTHVYNTTDEIDRVVEALGALGG